MSEKVTTLVSPLERTLRQSVALAEIRNALTDLADALGSDDDQWGKIMMHDRSVYARKCRQIDGMIVALAKEWSRP